MEVSHPTPLAQRAPHSKRARSLIDSPSLSGGEQWSRTTHANVPSAFKTASSPARFALRCGSGRTRTSRRECGAHRLPSELRPRRIPLPWSGRRDSNPQPLGSGPSALARLSYTQVSSARWESNPDRTRIRRPGLTETTRGTAGEATSSSLRWWAICESNAVQAPYQGAQGDQPVMARGANERIRTSTARGLSPPPPASWATLAQPCERRDSNPHWPGFEAGASCRLGYVRVRGERIELSWACL